MRLTFLADLRSPIARQWIHAFVERGDDVQAISSYPVDAVTLPGARVSVVPLVFSGVGAGVVTPHAHRLHPPLRALRRVATPSRAAATRAIIGPLSVGSRRSTLQRLVDEHRSEILHAMRIPWEGMAAAHVSGVPLVVSVWGNDFTLFARRTRLMARATRKTMMAASAIHCDCHRDARLARTWGFPQPLPVWVMPGNGGVRDAVFFPGQSGLRERLGIPRDSRIIVNPRGVREYVRNDVFFDAVQPVLEACPDVHVVCPGMDHDASLLKRVQGTDIAHRIHLMARLEPHEMADVFRAARVSVSLSTHDGTPNTLLEAMACGTLPIVGDVESVKEWIVHARNGLIVASGDRPSVVAALFRGVADDTLFTSAQGWNQALIRERARFSSCIEQAAEHYDWLASVTAQRGRLLA